MEPILADTVRFRVARLLAQRDAYLSQRDDLANAIGAHRQNHAHDAHEADSKLWKAYGSVMGHELDDFRSDPQEISP
jgi:hypothetical protein